jgi:6-phosphogluconolactonase
MSVKFALPVAVVVGVAAVALPGFGQSVAAIPKSTGFVYVMTNNPAGNAVLQFSRAENGELTLVDQESTGGLGGTGNGVGNVDPLGSQDSLVLSADSALLLAVNAGSNELSSLRVSNSGVTLISKVGSGGIFPNSVALFEDLVYVVNARGTRNVSGFRVNSSGALVPLPGSTRSLPGGAAAMPHDIRFSPDGTRLLVAEDGTNQIDIFELDTAGLITTVTTAPSSGPGPFGFTFGRRGVLIVTEAAAGAVSSYELTADNALDAISASVPNGQTAACWIALTRNGHSFISNTASSTLSADQESASGVLNLVNAAAANTGPGSAPIDSALSRDERFLYVIDSALGRMLIYAVDGNNLADVGNVTGLPPTIQGIAAR